MELSKNILDGLAIAGNSAELSDPLYNLILDEIFEVAIGKPVTQDRKDKFTNSSEKSAYSSMLSLLLEAAKHDTESSSLSTLFEDCRVDSNRTSNFLKKFQENKELIQTHLSLVGKSFHHIIDVKWRQDFVIKSSNCEKICEPRYIISLKTWNPQNNTDDDIIFSCTIEQLQDLVLKLKDATKCIERNSI